MSAPLQPPLPLVTLVFCAIEGFSGVKVAGPSKTWPSGPGFLAGHSLVIIYFSSVIWQVAKIIWNG